MDLSSGMAFAQVVVSIWQFAGGRRTRLRWLGEVGLGLLDSGAPREALGSLELADGNDPEIARSDRYGRADRRLSDAYRFLERADRARPKRDDSLLSDRRDSARPGLDPHQRGLSGTERLEP
ncbi:MAG: hypothetical protein R2724_18980 [Bryobacterales bacterium]